MKFFKKALIFYLALTSFASMAQTRRIINIPDIEGYQTMKCDFHMHTVFSDGDVWPTVRVSEAWAEGLDAISITDHIEYRPHSDDLVSDHNRSYQIAKQQADELKIILIKGTEITRSMPPGHFNALFIKDANPIDKNDVFDAIGEAHKQGAFILWNHPGWKAQQPDTTLWWAEHTKLYDSKMLNGIEVFNGDEYSPEALGWAKEKNLTIFGNTDAHDPLNGGKLRAMTLVFVKNKTEEGIREALFNRRTIAFSENRLAGDADLLRQLFFASLKFEDTPLNLKMKGRAIVYLENTSDVTYELELTSKLLGIGASNSVSLKAGEITPVVLQGKSKEAESYRSIKLGYKVKNVMTGKGENLEVELNFRNN